MPPATRPTVTAHEVFGLTDPELLDPMSAGGVRAGSLPPVSRSHSGGGVLPPQG